MNTIVKLSTAALLASAMAMPAAQAGETLDRVMSTKTLTMSSDPEYPPQSFLNDKNEMDGFDVDVGKEIAKRLGVELKIVTPGWDIITAGNWGDQWDMSVGSMTVTTGRQQVLDFADPPYYYTPAQFAAAEGSGIESVEDIAGAFVRAGEQDQRWGAQLATAFRTVATREKVSRRHTVMKRIQARWIDALPKLMGKS